MSSCGNRPSEHLRVYIHLKDNSYQTFIINVPHQVGAIFPGMKDECSLSFLKLLFLTLLMICHSSNYWQKKYLFSRFWTVAKLFKVINAVLCLSPVCACIQGPQFWKGCYQVCLHRNRIFSYFQILLCCSKFYKHIIPFSGDLRLQVPQGILKFCKNWTLETHFLITFHQR